MNAAATVPTLLRLYMAEPQQPLEEARAIVDLPPASTVAVDAMTPDQKASYFIGLAKMKKRLEALTKTVEGQISAVEQEVVEAFQEIGQQSIKRHGSTLALRREVWPKLPEVELPADLRGLPEDDQRVKDFYAGAESDVKAALVAALKSDASTEFLVAESYNSQRLRSWMLNDCDNSSGLPALPPHLEGKLQISEKFRATVTGA